VDVSPSFPTRSAPGSDPRIGAGALGAGLVAAGLALAFLTVETPLASRLVTGRWTEAEQLPYGALLWILGLVAGGGLLMAGTDRMAGIVAAKRWSRANGSPLRQALSMLPGDVDVVRGVVAQDGRPVPTLVVGSFGVAVIAEMERPDRLRRVDGSWQARTSEGWSPTEQPVDQTAREADRVRHWLNHGELDFVVRAHAALITTDVTIPRSPLCAVLTAEQVPAWIASLPRQRSITEGRRHVLVARARAAVPLSGRR
jgi:hypothetical protein